MARQNRNNRNFRKPEPKTKSCKCGGIQKLKTRCTYPHGKKSKAMKTQYFKCQMCGETSKE